MGTKNNPGKYDCYANAKPDEPNFTLVARDITMPPSVLLWALQRASLIMAGIKPIGDVEMIEEALTCAKSAAEYKGEQHASVPTLIAQVEQAIHVIKNIKIGGIKLESQESPDRFAPSEATTGTDPAGRLAADADHYD